MIDNPSPANLPHPATLAPLHETVAPLLESAEPEPFTPPPTAVQAPSPLPRRSKRRPKPRDNNLHRAARQANLHPAPRQTPGVSLTHHQPLCTICNHPDRDAIDEAFLHWERPSAIAHHFQLNDRRILYRHAHALDLFRKRAARSRRALEFIMEQAETVTATADSVIRAVKAHACLDEDGHWHEPVKRLIVTHRYVDSAADSEALGTGLAASFSPLPTRHSPLRPASAAGKVSGRSRQRSPLRHPAKYLDTRAEKKPKLSPHPSTKPPKSLDTLSATRPTPESHPAKLSPVVRQRAARGTMPRLFSEGLLSLFRRVPRTLILVALLSTAIAAATANPSWAQTETSAARQLTVERIYGSPSLSGQLTEGIEWAPDGKRFSYFAAGADGNGAALWTMDATTGARKVLVDAATLSSVMQAEKEKAVQGTGLARAGEKSYLWAPDGRSLLFIGSDSLAVLDLTTMKHKKLVSGDNEIGDPKFSPDSKWVSFVREHNLWIVDAETGQARQLTSGGSVQLLNGELDWVYPEELDCRTAYWWSPDSTKIAYYEMNEKPVTRYPIVDMSSATGAIEYTDYPQAGQANPIVRVGVVAVAGSSSSTASQLPETRWMDTGSDTNVYIPRVDWLPDSRRVAIQRLNRAQNQLDLLFCDAATGASKHILTQRDKYWINISDDLYFFSDGKRFLWSSEQTGFRHYYLYDMSGKQTEQLTSGDWGITGPGGFGPGAASHPAVDEAHGYIYFMSDKANVTESQLFRVSLRDNNITQITRGSGTHDVLIAPDTFDFVDTFSKAGTPPRQDLFSAEGTRVATVNENNVAELAEYHLSPVEFLNLRAGDGTTLYAMMIKPPDFTPSKKYPVLISVYGGPEAQQVRNAWGGANFLWHEMMAEKGYIIFTVDNRGSYNRGHAFETPVYHHFGKIELEDQLAGVNYLKSLPYVDASRIGIWGWSYGGYMTLYSMTHAQGVFKAGVSVAPVSDWKLYDTIYTERYMGTPQENPDGYRDSSPVSAAAGLSGKLMMVHGTGDDNVHFANTAEFINELIDANRYPARLMVFPGRGHPISDHAARIQLFQRITQFFVDNL